MATARAALGPRNVAAHLHVRTFRSTQVLKGRALLVGLTVVLLGCNSTSGSAARPAPSASPLPPAPTVAASPAQTPTLTPRTPEPDSILMAIRMTSLYVMWAATQHQLFRSTDSGRHWSEITPAGASPVASYALDDQAAWFVDPTAGTNAPFNVWRTTDGGRTWAQATATHPPGFVMGMSFVDRAHGWITVSGGAAAGSQGVAVMRSSNGGASWSLVAQSADPISTLPDPSGLEFGCDKSPTTFGSPTIGLLPTFCAGGPPYIYRSVDGGVHWKSIALPSLAGSQASGGGCGTPIFITPTDAVMVGDYYSPDQIPAMLVTQNAGAGWRSLRLPGDASLDFESTTSGWILTDPIRATVDGGASWHALSIAAPPFKPTDMTLQFLGRGIALAWSQQAAFRTDDGGLTWRSVAPARLLV